MPRKFGNRCTSDLNSRGDITIRCTRSRGPRDFFCLQDIRRGPVNVAVILPMELDTQIMTLEEIGFEFRDRKVVKRLLECYEWWEYHNSPFTLLMEQLIFWAACKQTRLCRNLVSWDFKGLRHDGWFKMVATDLAELSSNATRLRIVSISENLEDDMWRMQYRLPAQPAPIKREVVTRFPYKYASWFPAIEIAKDFATNSHCFINFSKNEPALCWLPITKLDKLNEILLGRFEPLRSPAG